MARYWVQDEGGAGHWEEGDSPSALVSQVVTPEYSSTIVRQVTGLASSVAYTSAGPAKPGMSAAMGPVYTGVQVAYAHPETTKSVAGVQYIPQDHPSQMIGFSGPVATDTPATGPALRSSNDEVSPGLGGFFTRVLDSVVPGEQTDIADFFPLWERNESGGISFDPIPDNPLGALGVGGGGGIGMMLLFMMLSERKRR